MTFLDVNTRTTPDPFLVNMTINMLRYRYHARSPLALVRHSQDAAAAHQQYMYGRAIRAETMEGLKSYYYFDDDASSARTAHAPIDLE